MDLVDSEPAPGVQEELSRFGRRILRCFQVFCCFDAQDIGKAFACGCQAASQAVELVQRKTISTDSMGRRVSTCSVSRHLLEPGTLSCKRKYLFCILL